MGLKYEWNIKKHSKEIIKELIKNYNLTEVQSKIFLSRNISKINDIKEYLINDYDEGFDPFLLSDMEKSKDRIYSAIEKEEKILIYGDYDADGITSTVLLLETLSSLGANVTTYIPNRFSEGYGPNKQAFEKIIKSGVSLIITVDNGIAAIEEVEFANSLGCDVIITDHHQIQNKMPNAFSIIHPEHPNFKYPFKKLAGVGVAFKLAHALLEIFPDFLLDLVAIGTISDLVPMESENRLFVKNGLKLINENTRIGIKHLLNMSNFNGKIDEKTISFIIAPRINAIGRLSSAKEGILLFTEENEKKAYNIAEKINELNIERKNITKDILIDVEKKINNNKNNLLIIYGENYHEGVLGIVASNIVEKYNKPALIINKKGNILKGSARSTNNFNIYEAMEKIKNLFSAFGGHNMAAGFTTNIENIATIEKKLNESYNNFLKKSNKKTIKNIDFKISLENISYQLLGELEKIKPFGMNFEEPIILLENVNVIEKIKFGENNQYLKIIIKNKNQKFECVSFKNNDIFDDIKEGDIISIIFNLEKNNFYGKTKLQFSLIDIEKKDFIFADYRDENIELNLLDINELKLSNYYNDEKNNFFKYDQIKKLHHGEYKIINIIDIPHDKEIIYNILKLKPKKIKLLFSKNLNRKYILDKNKLIKLFNITYNQKSILLEKEFLNKLLKILKIDTSNLKIMIKILLELDLISYENNKIKINQNYKNIKLEKSQTYMKINKIIESENFFTKNNIENINNEFCQK